MFLLSEKCLFLILAVINKHFNLSDMNFSMKNIRIHFGIGSGSTFSKCGSEDPDPLLRKGGSEDSDPDPLFPNVYPRIRIRIHI